MPTSVAWNVVTTIILKLAVEAVIAAALVELIIPILKRAGVTLIDEKDS
jgi:hypothetical protein